MHSAGYLTSVPTSPLRAQSPQFSGMSAVVGVARSAPVEVSGESTQIEAAVSLSGVVLALRAGSTVRVYARQHGAVQWMEIDPEQVWFWSAEWQRREREAEEDLREGRFQDFDSLDDLLNSP